MIPAFEIEQQRRQRVKEGGGEEASGATSGRDYHSINISLQKKPNKTNRNESRDP